MVLTLAIPLRHFLRLEAFITGRHLANAAKVLVATGWLIAYAYAAEIFTAYYRGDQYEIHMTEDRWFGAYAPV